MAKRSAAKQLTDDNWDQEDEPEEAGVFSRANDDAIKGRQILKAKRRTAGSGEGGSGPTAFSGFGGFAFKPTQTSTPVVTFGEAKTQKTMDTISETPSKDPASEVDKNGSTTPVARKNYLSQLKDLNQSVMDWITQHVHKNPYCILTPIFKDYEKHLGELEKEEGAREANGKQNQDSQEATTQSQEEKKEEKPVPRTGLTFGMGNLNTAKSAFGATATPFSGFNFKPNEGASGSGASGFSFAVGSSKPLENVAEKDEEEEYVPPKPEVMEHKEEDSLFSKKCKLFYQKDGAWTERGVGHLHLKKTDGAAQLLVRADTALGNILLNIRLNSAVPLSRQGKNNVSMMCVPNPAIPNLQEDKSVPMLIRVKTAEDADELLKQMQEIQS